MRRCSWQIIALLTCVLVGGPLPQAAGAGTAVQEAVVALQHQDYKGAEQKLRAELKLHPNDAETLSLLGVALDEQKDFKEAAEFHKRAVASARGSTAVLYNYANHLLATGDEKSARETLLKAIALNPADQNANMALAQLALNRKDGKEALACLDRLKDGNAPGTAILRLAALDLAGNRAEASALFQQLATATQNDERMSSEAGRLLANAGQFDQAETFLTHALAMDPANFQLLYSLGVAASQAGHNERALSVLESALRQQPTNVDALYALALVYNAMAQPDQALRLLAQAAKLDPERADVQKLTAITARDFNADEDSVAAWDRYLKLVPDDEGARRERAFGQARLALLDKALPELQSYVERHPDDPVGYYELGMAESVDDPMKAIATLDHAIALKPDFLAARGGRGILLYVADKPEAALQDLEFAVSRIPPGAPGRAGMLDRLGQTYSALNRLADAIPVLREAAKLAPDDATTLLHLANALAEAGNTKESDALMARFRQMNPGKRTPAVRGVVDYLSMTPEQRHDLYRARLEKAVHDHPDDANSQVLYLEFLLSDNQMTEAAATAQKLIALKPGTRVLADAGHALLQARQFSTAMALLAQVPAADSSVDITLDLAVATFHAAGADPVAAGGGLRQLEGIPEGNRTAGYYVARAEMLDATGKTDDALTAMGQALLKAPDDPGLCWQAAVLMTRNHRVDDALRLLDRAEKTLPANSQSDEALIPVIRVAVLELAGRKDEAAHLSADAQRRWPEVAAVWVAQGINLAARRDDDAARKNLETAVALGAHSPEVWYALAESSFRAGPEYFDAAEKAVGHALKAAPDDAQIQALSAKISASKGATSQAPVSSDETVDPAKLYLTRPPQDW